jgi:hypothetical protein
MTEPGAWLASIGGTVSVSHFFDYARAEVIDMPLQKIPMGPIPRDIFVWIVGWTVCLVVSA